MEVRLSVISGRSHSLSKSPARHNRHQGHPEQPGARERWERELCEPESIFRFVDTYSLTCANLCFRDIDQNRNPDLHSLQKHTWCKRVKATNSKTRWRIYQEIHPLFCINGLSVQDSHDVCSIWLIVKGKTYEYTLICLGLDVLPLEDPALALQNHPKSVCKNLLYVPVAKTKTLRVAACGARGRELAPPSSEQGGTHRTSLRIRGQDSYETFTKLWSVLYRFVFIYAYAM